MKGEREKSPGRESGTAVDVAPEVVIRAPRSVVASYMFDPRNDPEWTKNVKSVRPAQEGPLREGSSVEILEQGATA